MKYLLWGLLLPAVAWGACEPNAACLTWDASPTAGISGYRIYRVRAGLPALLLGQTTGLAYVAPLQPYGNQCYYVTAFTTDAESIPSNQACKFVRPYAPTDGAIETR